MTRLVYTARFALAASLLLLAGCDKPATPLALENGPRADWPAWGGSPGGGHFTPLAEITADNVGALGVAWVHRSGDYRKGPALQDQSIDVRTAVPGSSFQATPIVVEDTLYYCTPFNRVFALDPESGEERWMFDPQVDTSEMVITHCRGVSSWIDRSVAADATCRHRIFAPTLDGRIIALDGKTGQRCAGFSDDGEVELTRNLGDFRAREYGITSPPAIIGDTLVTGAFVIDAWDTKVPAGVVRAFDARSGEQRWSWNPVAPGKAPMDADGNFVRGTTNVWSVISVDEKLGLVYVPTGNSSPDYYGGHREGHLDHYSSSIVALNAATGEVAWHVQTVHHDIWDFDVPAQPTLVDLERDGEIIPALVQVTKMGLTWVVDRRTGEPLFDVEERKVPQSGAVAGEYLSATQPFPRKPEPLHQLEFGPDDAWGVTFWDRGVCRDKIAALDHGPIYTPISTRGTVLFPAPTGGNNWGSPAVDPERGVMIASAMHVPFTATLAAREQCTNPRRQMPQTGTPYCVQMELLTSPLGAPCSAPPWSTLAAVDLASGDIRWQVPLGTLEDTVPLFGRFMRGSPGFGGALSTASGLIFIAAAADHNLHVFDVNDGRELHTIALPTQAASVPMSYRVREAGRQFVVIAVGGHWSGGAPSGDYLMAFALQGQ